MKWIKRLLVLIVILIAGGALAGYLLIDGIVKSVVEKQGTAQLNVPTTLGGVALGLIHGTVNLDNFAVGSPAGFTAPQMLSVGKLAVDTGGVMRLRDEPIHIASINIDQPQMVIEQHGTKVNFRELMNGMQKSTEPAGKTEPSTASGESKPVKLVIDTLTISKAHVLVQSDLPGLSKPYDLTLPDMTIKNIGNADGADNGAAIKDVVSIVINHIVEQTTKSGKLPINISDVLSGNVDAVKSQLGDAAQKELDKAKVPVNLNGVLNQLTGQKKQ